MLWSMGSQRVGHNRTTELNYVLNTTFSVFIPSCCGSVLLTKGVACFS